MVTVAGASLGLLFAWWGVTLLGQLAPMFRLELIYDVHVDWRVTMFSIGVAGMTVIACGLMPAMQATRIDLSTAMKERAAADRSVCACARSC